MSSKMQGKRNKTMARRKKPCDFCETDYIYSYVAKENQLAVEFYPDNDGLFAVIAFGFDQSGEPTELDWDMEFKFCPFCGRKLS